MSNHRSIETIFRHNTRLPPGFLRLTPLGTTILKPYLQQSRENSSASRHVTSRLPCSMIERSNEKKLIYVSLCALNAQHKYFTTEHFKRLSRGQSTYHEYWLARGVCCFSIAWQSLQSYLWKSAYYVNQRFIQSRRLQPAGQYIIDCYGAIAIQYSTIRWGTMLWQFLKWWTTPARFIAHNN